MRAGRDPVVLVYHGVDDVNEADDPRRLVLSPSRFEAQVRYLLTLGYRLIAAGQLVDEMDALGRLRKGTAALTFDDGFRNMLTVVLPILEELGVGGTFYVCPGLWGQTHERVAGRAGRLLEERDAAALSRAGMELASHSMSHPDLRQLDDAALASELRQSKAAIEDLTGRPCRTFAYPYGLWDERVQHAVADAGYEAAFIWGGGRRWTRLAVSRLPAPPRHGARRLALKLLRRRLLPPIAGDGMPAATGGGAPGW